MTDPATRAARLLLSRPARLGRIRLAAVDGRSGSGKTMFAARLAAATAAVIGGSVAGPGVVDPPTGPLVTLLGTDLLSTWTDPFGWWERLESELLQPLSVGRPGALRVNDWSSGQPVPGPVLPVAVPAVLILEGVSCSRRTVTDRLSLAVWIEVADRVRRLERAVARDGVGTRGLFERWQRDEDGFIRVDRAPERADLTVEPP